MCVTTRIRTHLSLCASPFLRQRCHLKGHPTWKEEAEPTRQVTNCCQCHLWGATHLLCDSLLRAHRGGEGLVERALETMPDVLGSVV